MPTSTYRPRITRELRDRVLEAGEKLNGTEPDNYQHALRLFIRYLDVLSGTVECPECGATDAEDFENGNYRCWRCGEDRHSGYFDVWDVIQPDDKDNAALPGLPRTIQLRFECDHEEHDSGSNTTGNSSNVQNQQADTLNTDQDRWNDGF